MYLIVTHQKNRYLNYIEGFYKEYGCITFWNDGDSLQLLQSSFFNYTSENRVPKYTKPFN